jgi:hypothetical protein
MPITALRVMDRRALRAGALAGTLAALGVVGVTAFPVRLEPGTAGWRRLVRGADPDGSIPRGAVILLPGLARHGPALARIEMQADGPVLLGASLDGAPWPGPVRGQRQRRDTDPARPGRRGAPGAADRPRLFGAADPLVAVTPPRPPRLFPILLAFVLAAALTAALLRSRETLFALGTGLFGAGLLVLAETPPLLLMTLPAATAALPVLFPVALLAASAVVASRLERETRRAYGRAVLLVAAFVFGAWVRGAFLASAGSWDTEYWKAWTVRAADHGVTRVYGDPGAVPAGRLLAQMLGEEELWKVEFAGRPFVVDYPPLPCSCGDGRTRRSSAAGRASIRPRSATWRSSCPRSWGTSPPSPSCSGPWAGAASAGRRVLGRARVVAVQRDARLSGRGVRPAGGGGARGRRARPQRMGRGMAGRRLPGEAHGGRRGPRRRGRPHIRAAWAGPCSPASLSPS